MTQQDPRNFPDGTVIAWYVVDPETMVLCLRCETREEARQYRDSGLICKLVKAH